MFIQIYHKFLISGLIIKVLVGKVFYSIVFLFYYGFLGCVGFVVGFVVSFC